MSDETEVTKPFSMDWRIMFGIGLTTIWIVTGLIYLVQIVGMPECVLLPTGDIGSFLEGAFAPLAFLWLVIGHFMQQSEISGNTRAIKLQEQSAKRQEVHAQRNSYFKLLTLVQEQLGSIAGFHYVSVVGPTGTKEITGDEYAVMRGEAVADPSLFVRKMVSMTTQFRENPGAATEVFFGTAIRTRHSDNFTDTFGRLLASAEAVDHDDLVASALLYGSPSGMLYRIINMVREKKPVDEIFGFTTIQKKAQEQKAL